MPLFCWFFGVYTAQYAYFKILTDFGQADTTEDFIKEQGLGIEDEITNLNEFTYAAYARFLIIQYKLDDAEAMLAKLYKLAETGKRIERLVELKLLYAMMYKMKNDYEKAIMSLIEAMELAIEENILIGFIDLLIILHYVHL